MRAPIYEDYLPANPKPTPAPAPVVSSLSALDIISNFTPSTKMPAQTTQPGEPGFVGPVATKSTASTWTKAGTVQTVDGPVDVNAQGRAIDGSMPIAAPPGEIPVPKDIPKTTGVYSGSGTKGDPFSLDGKPFSGTIFGSTYANGVITNPADDKAALDKAALDKEKADLIAQGKLDARVEFANTLKALGLPQALVDELDNMIKQDYTKSQMYLELQKTQAWKDRFPGMKALADAGKAVDAGTYISMEKGFLQTLDYYGVDKKLFGSTAELGKQIGNLVSPKAFEERVALAAQDVEKNKDVLAELNLYYGVDKSAAIAYLLNPEIGLDIIKRQARAAEIGAAAAKSKFDFGNLAGEKGYGVAESFINASGTMDQQSLDAAFAQARTLGDTQARLAAIEGQKYNDLSAVTAILGKDQAALLDSQRRAAREVARYSGGSGLTSSSLKTQSTI